MKTLNLVVRWGLGIHGAIHMVEFILNLIEHAWMSAFFTLIAASLMLAGALIDSQNNVYDTKSIA